MNIRVHRLCLALRRWAPVLLITLGGTVGRVTIRYSGKTAHQNLIVYVQTKCDSLDRTPGQIIVGPIKVYPWHGFKTKVTLRFDARLDHGIIFFESRALRETVAGAGFLDGSLSTVDGPIENFLLTRTVRFRMMPHHE